MATSAAQLNWTPTENDRRSQWVEASRPLSGFTWSAELVGGEPGRQERGVASQVAETPGETETPPAFAVVAATKCLDFVLASTGGSDSSPTGNESPVTTADIPTTAPATDATPSFGGIASTGALFATPETGASEETLATSDTPPSEDSAGPVREWPIAGDIGGVRSVSKPPSNCGKQSEPW